MSHDAARAAFLRLGYRPVDAAAYPVLRRFQRSKPFAECSAVSLTAWAPSRAGVYALQDNCLCVALFPEDALPYVIALQPPGAASDPPVSPAPPAPPALIGNLFEQCREAGVPALTLACVDLPTGQPPPDWRPPAGLAVAVSCDEAESEYVFAPPAILGLDGPANAARRARLRRVERLHGPLTEQSLTRETAGIMLDMQAQWCAGRSCADCRDLYGCEKDALENVIAIYDEAVLDAFALLDRDGRAAAYSLGERRDDGRAYGFFGKGRGADLFAAVIHAQARRLSTGLTSFNIGEDLGSPGLRRFKSGLGASSQLRRYRCVFTRP